MKKIKTFAQRLKDMNACDESIKWVGRKSMKTAWAKCENTSWMFWLLERVVKDRSDEHRRIILCACDIARLSLPEWEKYDSKDKRPHLAIEAAESFANEWTMKPESEEKSAAWEAASAAWSAAWSAESAASAAWSAASAARSAARSAVRSEVSSAACDIIRKHFPECPMEAMK